MANEYSYLVGKRVAIPVWYDMWMQGARYGVVASVTPKGMVSIKPDAAPTKRVRVRFEELEVV